MQEALVKRKPSRPVITKRPRAVPPKEASEIRRFTYFPQLPIQLRALFGEFILADAEPALPKSIHLHSIFVREKVNKIYTKYYKVFFTAVAI